MHEAITCLPSDGVPIETETLSSEFTSMPPILPSCTTFSNAASNPFTRVPSTKGSLVAITISTTVEPCSSLN